MIKGRTLSLLINTGILRGMQEINKGELAVKAKSKAEFHRLLCQDGVIYLPPVQDTTY
jgi:hypothetical protein